MNREDFIKSIVKGFTLLKYEIEHRQVINDYALNIYSENFYRDMLNIIYNYELENEKINYKTLHT